MMEKIKIMFVELDCLCLSEAYDTIELMSNEGVRFDVFKTDKGYVVCENDIYPEPFKFWFKFNGELTMQDVKYAVDLISKLRFEYLNSKESHSFPNVMIQSVASKLRDLGAEDIEVYPYKIEFVWCLHICKYENGIIYCGRNGMLNVENISDLNTNELDSLVGKLTNEQLDRLGVVIDLYDDTIKHLESQLDDMKSVGMYESDLYFNKEEEYRKHTEFVAILRTSFETREIDDYKGDVPVLKYVLIGE